jgi:cell wall-associated NlpC family hydrolase
MTVKIGHASLDENKKASGGRTGDQTGNEVTIQNWYNRNWTILFRAKDSKVAEKIAQAMEQACANDKVGYDQKQRTTLYEQAKKLNWDISKINTACECDCSSLVAVCVNAAGINVSKDMYTGNQKAVLTKTGKFEVLTDSKYLVKQDHLQRGDILLASGHTAIVLSNNTKLSIDHAQSYLSSLAGTYKVTATKLNIRSGAGTQKRVITTVLKNTEIRCYGYYTKLDTTNWLYVQFKSHNITVNGFASAKYLTKK